MDWLKGNLQETIHSAMDFAMEICRCPLDFTSNLFFIDLRGELGVQAPVGFWDPLGLSADGDVRAPSFWPCCDEEPRPLTRKETQ